MRTAVILLLVISLSVTACQNQSVSSQSEKNTAAQNNKTTVSSSTSENLQVGDFEFFPNFYSKENSIIHHGFTAKKVLVNKKYDNDSPIAEIYDVILQRGGKKLLTFEGEYYPLGNEMGFGLLSFLGNEEKQLIISDISYKSGRSWIVNLSKNPRILFDSGEYGGFREFIDINDYDADGTYEITLSKYVTCDFDSLATAEMPLISFVFKYKKGKNKFLPANHKFQNLAKSKINEEISEGRNANKKLEFRNVLEIFLEYIYADMEKEAWEFFDENYLDTLTIRNSNFNGIRETANPIEDKKKARKSIENFLNKDSIYLAIKKDLTDK